MPSLSPPGPLPAGRRLLLHGLSHVLGPLPPGAGQHAVARRIVASSFLKPALGRQTLVGGGTFELDLSDRIQAEAFLIRRYAPELVQVIASRLSTRQVFFDVGANVGLVTFSVGARVPSLRIHAFEPHPLNVASWRRNAELNSEVNATIETAAVGATEGRASLVLGTESGWHHIADSPSDSTMDVPMVTLDDYADGQQLDFIHVLKLDVEGHEQSALQGARRLLRERRVGCIVCELNDFHLRRVGTSREGVIAWLGQQGFQPHPIPRIGLRRLRRAETAPTDLIFLP
jgi:FkbM family methyltransferase